MRYKWFWMTLLFWTGCGVAVSAWALIFSPHRPDFSEIAAFSGEVNGSRQDHEISVSAVSLEDARVETEGRWRREGWTPVGGPANFASVVLGLKDDGLLDPTLRVSLFAKEGRYRVLGFLRDPRKNLTYRWVGEIPKETFNAPSPGDPWDFPIAPPRWALHPYFGRLGEFQMATWGFPSDNASQERFLETCRVQGFEGKIFSESGGEIVYILTRGSVRLIAVLTGGNSVREVSLVWLGKAY